MDSAKKSPTYLINSRDRINRNNSTDSSFEFKINLETDNQFDSVILVTAHIPKKFYTVSNNAFFTLIEDGMQEIITMPEGNYNYNNLPVILKGLFDQASINMLHNWVYTITFPNINIEPDTTKLTFSVSGNGGLQPSVSFVNDIKGEAHQLLGFPHDQSPHSFIADKLISSNIVSFVRTQFIVIKSNIALNSGSGQSDTAILARIPLSDTHDEVISYDLVQLEDGVRELGSNTSNIFSFTIFDDHDRILELNGYPWTASLLIYKSDDTTDLIKKYIKLRTIENTK